MPIQASDYERPLSFSFGEGVEILSADISKAIPKSLNPSITIEKSRVVFVPILLNSKDQIQISLLLAKYQGVVEPDVRITGITDVKEHYYGPISNIDDKYWLRRSTSITTWMVIFWILFRFPINPTPFFHENLLITFFLAFLTAIILDWIIESAILFTRLLLSGNKFVWK